MVYPRITVVLLVALAVLGLHLVLGVGGVRAADRPPFTLSGPPTVTVWGYRDANGSLHEELATAARAAFVSARLWRLVDPSEQLRHLAPPQGAVDLKAPALVVPPFDTTVRFIIFGFVEEEVSQEMPETESSTDEYVTVRLTVRHIVGDTARSVEWQQWVKNDSA